MVVSTCLALVVALFVLEPAYVFAQCPDPIPGLQRLVAINAGGPALPACGWLAGNASRVSGGSDRQWAGKSTNPYATARVGAALIYSFNVTGGNSYVIRLHFAELFHNRTNGRIIYFRTGPTVPVAQLPPPDDQLDIFAMTRQKFAGHISTVKYDAPPGSNTLYVGIFAVKDRALVCGLELYLAGPGPAPGPAPVFVDAPCPPPATGLGIRIAAINCGGPAVCEFDAQSSATNVVGGQDDAGYTNSNTQLYRSVRWGTDFSYNFAVVAGVTYNIRLHFAEVYWPASKQRIFNVSAGPTLDTTTVVLTNIDPFNLTGQLFRGVIFIVPYTAPASSNILYVHFTAVVDRAAVAGIEVFSTVIPPPNPPPRSSPPPSPAPPPSPIIVPGQCKYTVQPPAGVAAQIVAQINMGGPAMCGFQADLNFRGGQVYNRNGAGGTDPLWLADNIAAYTRESRWFYYIIPVRSARRYHIRVGYAQRDAIQARQRLQVVQANGVQLIEGVDISAETGNRADTAVFRTATWESNLGETQLALRFESAWDDYATFTSLEVYDIGASALPAMGPMPASVTSNYNCSRIAPPALTNCPDQVSDLEVAYGWGAYYFGADSTTCTETAEVGHWSRYREADGDVNGDGVTELSCCRACRWNHNAVAGFLPPAGSGFPDVPDCPPCVADYYRWKYRNNVPLEPLSKYQNPQCPQGPGWIYNPTTNKCYFKNNARGPPGGYGISGNTLDALAKCRALGGTLVHLDSKEESDFVIYGLNWNGIFGEIYTGLKMRPRNSPLFDGVYHWATITEEYGPAIKPTDYQEWISPDRDGDDPNGNPNEAYCMEILPQKKVGRKKWNPFSCLVNKNFCCQVTPGTFTDLTRPAINNV